MVQLQSLRLDSSPVRHSPVSNAPHSANVAEVADWLGRAIRGSTGYPQEDPARLRASIATHSKFAICCHELKRPIGVFQFFALMENEARWVFVLARDKSAFFLENHFDPSLRDRTRIMFFRPSAR